MFSLCQLLPLSDTQHTPKKKSPPSPSWLPWEPKHCSLYCHSKRCDHLHRRDSPPGQIQKADFMFMSQWKFTFNSKQKFMFEIHSFASYISNHSFHVISVLSKYVNHMLMNLSGTHIVTPLHKYSLYRNCRSDCTNICILSFVCY